MSRLVPLPIDPLIPSILEHLKEDRAAVVVAEPGAGKTTRIPPAIVESGLLRAPNDVVLLMQPRRVAARAAATRIAEERGWRLGEQVGYVIRFERRVGPRTKLKVVTEGVLTRILLADPFLEGVGAVVLDEFHERSIHTDLAIAQLREVRATVRPDLFLMVMSATIDAGPVSTFLGNCPIVRSPGRAFSVRVEYRPSEAKRPIGERVAEALEHVLDTDPNEAGDVLVFLPGMEEIRRAGRAIEPLGERRDLLVLPLHGSLPAEAQDRALRPADRRKVVLATNVAETSLTIDGVRTVVDSGQARIASYDPARGLDRLVLSRISRASAEQRAGRAGRTAPGRCIRLWSERETRGMAAFDEPEVRRIDLAGTLLTLGEWRQIGPDASFDWFEEPPVERYLAGVALLEMLEAVEPDSGSPTPLGRALLDLPVHPRLGRLMIAAAEVGRLREGAAMAAILSEREFCEGMAEPGASDVLVRLDQLEEAEAGRFSAGLRSAGIDPVGARQVARVRDDLIRIGRRLPSGEVDPSDEALLRALLLAYPDRVARRRGVGVSVGTMVGGRGVRLDPRSVVREAELFLALDPRDERRGGTTEARVRLASAIDRAWLDELFPGSVTTEVGRFDPEQKRVTSLRTTRYRDLVLSEDADQPIDRKRAGELLAEHFLADAEAFIRGDEAAARWLDRLRFAWVGLGKDGPYFLEEDALEQVVRAACRDRRSEEEARRAPLMPLLQGHLHYEHLRAMEAYAPEFFVAPSGNRARIEYDLINLPPSVEVRIQELYGLRETPTVANGRVRLKLVLLGPNFRPVQVTDDLPSFWATTYFQVRKDLRNRYPKHSWPDDPLTARPEAKGSRRREGG